MSTNKHRQQPLPVKTQIRILESVRTISDIVHNELLSLDSAWHFNHMANEFKINASLSELYAELGEKEKTLEQIRRAAVNTDTISRDYASYADAVRDSDTDRADYLILSMAI